MAGEALATPRLTRKGQATRDRIVAAAAELMFQRGVSGTSTDDVQTAAGVNTSQIYHYFGDKRNLVRAVIAFQTESILAAQQPLLSRLDTMDALHAWRDAIVELQHVRQYEGGCPIGSLVSELAERDAEARADLAAGFSRWEAAIGEGLRAMHQRGDLRPEADPDQLALALLAALQGGLLLTQTRRDTVALEAAMDTMLAHIESFCA
ncbi:MAG TPA: TetR/AcrR family transcriptional regulator [Pseudonocardiaceae bacterium]|nr:TetR/AcrR family transcriptional regulator [Pseudonocardiaceae bacterium]